MPWSAKASLHIANRRIVRTFSPVAIFALLLNVTSLAQAGISNEGALTVFRTGGTEPLLSLMLPLRPPPTNTAPLLQFDFGFATDETNLPGAFFDSFSVTIQGDDPSQSVLLLTADTTGVIWAPPNPGGINVDPAEILHQTIPAENVNPKLALRVAYSVSFILPADLLGRPIKVFLDLFDNLDGTNSLAYVKNLRLPTPIRLQSAATSNGPFADENSASLNEIARTFALGVPSGHRFFRIVADRTLRISDITSDGNQLSLTYAPVQLKLESISVIRQAFSEMSNIALDEINRTFTFNRTSGPQFFRIASDVNTRLKAPRIIGDQVVIEYEFNP
jgi:hypothetical protein